jgi:hypothetical protein
MTVIGALSSFRNERAAPASRRRISPGSVGERMIDHIILTVSDVESQEVQPFLRLNFATVWVRDQELSLWFFVDQLGFQHALSFSNGFVLPL